MPAFINHQDFEELRKTHYDSLLEYVKMISDVHGSLKTGLTGEELAAEIIKGSLTLKKFIETGEVSVPSPAGKEGTLQFSGL
jgi:hypothetical protein